MYALYADVDLVDTVELTDDKALYTPTLPAEEYPIGSAVLTEGLNTINTLVFTIPPTNKNYELVQLMKWVALVRVNDDGTVDDVYRGRIINIVDTLEGTMTVTCESALALLRDAVDIVNYEKGQDAQFVFEEAVKSVNAYIRPCKAGTCEIDDQIEEVFEAGDNVLADIMTLVSTFGGYITTRVNKKQLYVDWKKSSGPTVTETIEIGKNLVDFAAELDGSNLYTAIVTDAPYDPGSEDREIGPVRAQSILLAEQYGVIYKKRTYQKGLTRGEYQIKAAIDANKLPGPSTTLTVKAIQLDSVKVGSYVPVYRHVSTEHQSYQLTEKVTDILNPANSTFTLGRRTKRLTEF